MIILEKLSDEEILEAIQEGFEDDGRLNMNYIDVEVVDKGITIAGRVSREEELQIIDDVMKESLEITDYNNKAWVDESLSHKEDEEEDPDIKSLTFEDNEIDDEDYSEEDEEEEGMF